MLNVSISDKEKLLRIQALQAGVRYSQRDDTMYRPLHIEVDQNKCDVTAVKTSVSATVTFDPDGKPLASTPNQGHFKLKIDWTPSVCYNLSNRKIDEYSDYLQSLFHEAFDYAEIVNLSDLCITANKKCWIINIDVLVLSCDGNLLDIMSLAIHTALRNTKIPKINFSKQINELKFNMSNCPIFVTVNKIDTKYLIDCTKEEEDCSSIKTISAILSNGDIKCTSTIGNGSLKIPCLLNMLKMSKLVGVEMHLALEEYDNTQCTTRASIVDDIL